MFNQYGSLVCVTFYCIVQFNGSKVEGSKSYWIKKQIKHFHIQQLIYTFIVLQGKEAAEAETVAGQEMSTDTIPDYCITLLYPANSGERVSTGSN